MDYNKAYTRLIARGKLREPLTGYKERHHIIPRCMGGDDDPLNLVDLTPEEHYVAHQLLVKIYPNYPHLIFALVRMSKSGEINGNKLYGWLRRRAAIEISKIQKGVPKSEEHKRKMSLAKLGKKQTPEHIAKRIASLKTEKIPKIKDGKALIPRKYLRDMTIEEAREYWREKELKKQEKKDRISITALLYSII